MTIGGFVAFIKAVVVVCVLQWDVEAGGRCGVAKGIVRAAHSYHGVLISWEDERGDYFIRDGKRCKLISEAFKRWYNDRRKENS